MPLKRSAQQPKKLDSELDTWESSISAPAPCGFCEVGGIRQNDIELCCNRVLILVFLTENRGLFKLLLRGKWQELVLMVRKSFHPITNSLPMWPEVFLFQEAIAELLESHLVLMVTNPSVAGKNHRSNATQLCSKAVLGLLFHRTLAFYGCEEALGKGCLTRAE